MSSRYVDYNTNPYRKSVGDCVVRALSVALNQPWRKTYWDLCTQGDIMCDMPSSNAVWGEYLYNMGFRRKIAELNTTVDEFCTKHKYGVFILDCDSHVVAAIDGKFYDTWNSGNETIIYYWEGY